ncbi:MAG TPA: ChbG/HpnK family deacetylase [Candidatus Limnocylindrales bacterium]|nr:ChbG/HpnK family deacetylase [Candidatus Limnocylindrales bacterium]
MKLIVNADDFGYTAGVTRGIIRAHTNGIVTATTLMANAPDAAGAARAARSTPTLDVGVHLVFTYGRALSAPEKIPSLVSKDGSFPKVRDLLRSGQATAEDALTEARAQYARARELLGREPTHLDSHHWVHDLRAIEDAVLALAKETGAAARTHDGRQRGRFRDAGVRTPDRFVREYQHTGKIGPERLVVLLEVLAEDDGIIELMCHPGEPDEALLAGSSYAEERAVELEALTDASVRDAVERLHIQLVDFRAA